MLARYDHRLADRRAKGLPVRALTARESKELHAQGLHYCPGCECIKPVTEFSTTRHGSGISPYCRECANEIARRRNATAKGKAEKQAYYQRRKRQQRDNTLRREFGITIDQYEAMLVEQNNVCAICGGVDKSKSLAVDHDHKTGKVRSLLCGRCNPAVGFLLDNPEYARKVLAYIEKWSS